MSPNISNGAKSLSDTVRPLSRFQGPRGPRDGRDTGCKHTATATATVVGNPTRPM